MQFELTHLVDALPGLGWTALPDGRAEFLNQRWLDYAGMTAEQAAGLGWAAAIHPDDRTALVEKWRSCLASGTPVDTEARMCRYDGAYRWFLFRANPVRDTEGNICRWFGTNIDIEDRRRSGEALRASERNLSLIINTIPTFIHVVRTDGSVLYVNQAVLDYTGLTLKDVQKEDYRDRVFHPEDVKRLREERREALTHAVPFENEQRVLGKDGRYRWFMIRYSPLLDEQGRIDRWYVVSFDIEDRKRAEAQVEQTYLRLAEAVTESRAAEEALNRARSELAQVSRVTTLNTLTASIAHEVNQPLSGIITNASTCLRMLNSDPPNVEGARETVRRTIRDGNRASDVISRLRALFSKKEFTLEPLNLNEATSEVMALSLGDLRANRVILRSELADDLPPVTGDRVQLQQVVLNLLRNASDAMVGVDDRPRELLIKTARDEGDGVRLSVMDAGVGFRPEVANKLFDAFYTTKNDGMGIGLSVSRSIIEAHHGRLWATANEGPGATFSFSIPCSAISTPSAREI